MTAPTKFECFTVADNPPVMRPAEQSRDWMNHTDHRFSYRCTPLNVANTSGWELLNPCGFTATWTGYNGREDVILRPHDQRSLPHHVSTGFGHGIVTFHPGYLFRTDAGWSVWARGAPNRLKHGIQALDGIIETSWLPFTFTMNWKFTAPGTVDFEIGEPFCFLTLVPSVTIEAVQPVLRPIADEPQLNAGYVAWKNGREAFIAGLNNLEPQMVAEKWQRHYLAGRSPCGDHAADADHRVKRSLKPPVFAPHNQLYCK